MSSSGQKTVPDVGKWWEALTDIREWSGGPPRCSEAPFGCLGVVGRPSRMFGSGREAHPDVREWSGDPPGCPGVMGGAYEYPGVL